MRLKNYPTSVSFANDSRSFVLNVRVLVNEHSSPLLAPSPSKSWVNEILSIATPNKVMLL